MGRLGPLGRRPGSALARSLQRPGGGGGQHRVIILLLLVLSAIHEASGRLGYGTNVEQMESNFFCVYLNGCGTFVKILKTKNELSKIKTFIYDCA